MPRKLEYAMADLSSKIDGVGIGSLEIEVGRLQEDGCILLNLVQKNPNRCCAESAEIGGAAKRLDVDVIGTAAYPLDCLGELDIIIDA
jgi:hypothetical protein